MKTKHRVLYITYLGILEPIPKSQVLPYILEFSKEAEIHLISFEKKHILIREGAELKRTEQRLREKGIVWHRLHYHKHPLVLSSFLDILLGIIASLFIIVKHNIKIVHARAYIPIAIGCVLKLFLHVKILYDRRGIMGEDHVEHSGWKKGGYLYRLAMWFDRLAVKKSDAVVVLTERMNTQLKNSLNLGNGSIIKTIPCCVDLGIFRYVEDKNLRKSIGLLDKFVLIYSGSVGTYNLLVEMFDFFNEVLGIVPNAHFVILTQNKDAVADLLRRRNGLDKDKITVTYAPQESLSLFLSMADAALVFRRTSPTAIAASPTKFGEYLACGLPVVSTPKIGDLEKIINANRIGVVLSGNSIPEYRQAIDRLLALLKDKEGLRQRCRKVAEDLFSLGRGAAAYLDIYNRLNR